MRLSAPVGTIFRKCVHTAGEVVCGKQTEGLCHCDKPFCHLHMKAHLESCEVAKEA